MSNRLHPDDLARLADLVADRVADRVAEETAQRVADLLADADAEAARGGPSLIDAQEAADLLGVSPRWVRQHADELGGMRLGSGARPRWRFDAALVQERVEEEARRGGAFVDGRGSADSEGPPEAGKVVRLHPRSRRRPKPGDQ